MPIKVKAPAKAIKTSFKLAPISILIFLAILVDNDRRQRSK